MEPTSTATGGAQASLAGGETPALAVSPGDLEADSNINGGDAGATPSPGSEAPSSAMPGNNADPSSDWSDIWPEEYNVPSAPTEPVEINLDDQDVKRRIEAMNELAASGDSKGIHTDEDLLARLEDAKDRRRPGPVRDGRTEFDNLRNRTDLPEDFSGPIHHEQFPIKDNPEIATDPEISMPRALAATLHKDLHRIFGKQGQPYRSMEPGFDEPGMQHTLDFANAHHEQLADKDGLQSDDVDADEDPVDEDDPTDDFGDDE